MCPKLSHATYIWNLSMNFSEEKYFLQASISSLGIVSIYYILVKVEVRSNN